MVEMKRFVSMFIAGAIGGLTTFGVMKYVQPTNTPQTTVIQAPARLTNANYGGVPPSFDFTKAAEKTMDAVVHIKASESKTSIQKRNQQTTPFDLFFGEGFGGGFNQPKSGTGSGVIYTADGYILTNNHVVDFADEFEVTLHDNRKFKARLVGRDENTDMAVIKIDAKDLVFVELADSDDVKVGEWVLAVGNPFDLNSTVTAGIVSAKGRDIGIIKGNRAIETFIQTDAAVNPGNSGGALVNTDGRLIGINSAIASPTGSFAGYSFAIPSNLVKRIADDLIKYGSFKRAYLGVEIVEMDNELAKELNIDYINGIAIMKVDESGSAAYGGLKENDIITQINSKKVTTIPELQSMVSQSKVGDILSVVVSRKGKSMELPVKLRSRASE